MRVKKFIVNPIQVNCYIIDDGSEAVMIDCGAITKEEREEIKNYIESEHLTLKHYLCTHMHFDHIFGNPFVEEVLGVKASASDLDIEWAHNIKQRTQMFGMKYDEVTPPLGRVLKDGDTVTFGSSTIEVIAVPGHSPGSLAYYLPEERILFSGDALFAGSIGRTDFPDSSHRTLIEGLKSRILTLPDDTIVYPGHDRSTTIEREKTGNFFLR